MRWAARLDIRAALPSIRVPTLVIHSGSNPVFRVDAGHYLAEHIPEARFVERKGRDLYLHSFTEADEVLDHVEEFITGEPPAVEADRAFATILFTDVVGSTNALAEVGDQQWKHVLDRHDQLVIRHLAQYRGRKIVSTGDGVLATFDGPARAVRCAQAIIGAVRPLGIELRAGLHAGEVELRGDDIGGIAVHIGQRVSALAGPGEVLVSRTVADLVTGSGLEFDDRGEHDLKGVPGAWKVFAVRG
jgi:class 3 adenylate cyclase